MGAGRGWFVRYYRYDSVNFMASRRIHEIEGCYNGTGVVGSGAGLFCLQFFCYSKLYMSKNGKTTLETLEKLLTIIIRDILYIKKNMVTKNDMRSLFKRD